GAVDGVPRKDVPYLVPHHEPLLFRTDPVDPARGHDEERTAAADRHGGGLRVPLDVQLGNPVKGQHGGGAANTVVDVGELALVDPYRAGQEHQPQRPLVEEAGEPLEDFVEAAQRPQGDEGAAVRGMLVGARRDVAEPDASTVWSSSHA